ncbi:hypothetical protein BCR39DRAFT_561281 [Naematelia encephala]|uniref:Uncharacterized protein n=1 Tax=Naematelia encephala TaxID=71784 RepID=A0A1Y2AQX8_9TREE|nr:hypothetical protein BCR39DRAFT_561281 [Naematelia encephala]
MDFPQYRIPHHPYTGIRQSRSISRRGRGIDLSFSRTSSTAQLKPGAGPYPPAGSSRPVVHLDNLGMSHLIPGTTTLQPELQASMVPSSPDSSTLSSLSSDGDDEIPNRFSSKIQESSTPLKVHDLVRNPQTPKQRNISTSPIPQKVSHPLTSTTRSGRRSKREHIQSQSFGQQRHTTRSKQPAYRSLSLQLREAEAENDRLQYQVDELEEQVGMAVEEEQYQAAKASEYRISFEETLKGLKLKSTRINKLERRIALMARELKVLRSGK